MGKELDKNYYNEVFKKSIVYSKEAFEIKEYYENWKTSYDFIIQNGIKNIVDLGCGPGHFPTLFEENKNITYLGYDFSETAITQAKSKNFKKGNNVNFIVKDLSKKNEDIFNQNFFVSFEFLEHISFDLDLLQNLKKDSKILFSVPSFDSKGHVRYFKNEKEVVERYENLFHLELLNIKKINNSNIFLFYGIRK